MLLGTQLGPLLLHHGVPCPCYVYSIGPGGIMRSILEKCFFFFYMSSLLFILHTQLDSSAISSVHCKSMFMLLYASSQSFFIWQSAQTRLNSPRLSLLPLLFYFLFPWMFPHGINFSSVNGIVGHVLEVVRRMLLVLLILPPGVLGFGFQPVSDLASC